MLVDRARLEIVLARVVAGVDDPGAGIHGPGSAAWQVERDGVIFLGGGRAALLQLAHPYVAYGVHQHSKTRDDMIGRFKRTFDNVFAMSFGTLADALTAARRVHNIHVRITGQLGDDCGAFAPGARYHANDVDALRWVWATLVDTVVVVYQRIAGPLSPSLREAYYRASWTFARLFGLDDEELPPTWDAFAAYVARTVASPVLTVTAPAREMAGFLFGGRLGPATRLVTAALLPESIRDQFGLRYGVVERAGFAATVAGVRALRRTTPAAAWDLPAYRDAQRRLAGLPPSAWTRWLEQRFFALAGRSAAAPRRRAG